MIMGFSDTLSYCCGVLEVGNFSEDSYTFFDEKLEDILEYSDEHSTGLCISTFIDNGLCKKAYKHIKEHMHILYQSPVYKNKGTGRDVFLIVYRKEL